MSLPSELHEREQWQVVQRHTARKARCDGRAVLDPQGAALAVCRDERMAALVAELLNNVGERAQCL